MHLPNASILALLVVFGSTFGSTADGPDRVEVIVQKSVQNTNTDWAAAPQYNFTEEDVITKQGESSVRRYQVMMIEGSPYKKLIAVNGRALPEGRAAAEDRKLQQETMRRHTETPAAREKRVSAYQRERRQDRELLQEMVQAFNFKLVGEDTVNGRRCWKLQATPRPRYQPRSRETKVLTGMRGQMCVDEQQEQWVRVHAEVFRPVAFGLFIARVEPGTEFTLEQTPIDAGIWLPSHFVTRVNARVLFSSRRYTDDERYSEYRRSTGPRDQKSRAQAKANDSTQACL